MAFGKTHELHQRRSGRNLGVAAVLIGFIAVVFGLSVAKITVHGPTEGFDHAPRAALVDRQGE